jgi:hypothetical protein
VTIASARPILPLVIALLPALLFGCFKPHDQLSRLDTEIVPFENPHVRSEDAVIRRYASALECPDGSMAPLYVVYRESTVSGAPVAIVLHSGAFDYVMERSEEGPLTGPHYHADSRLNPDFATAKVWETLGMQIVDLDPAENNQGTLPATLVDRDFVQLHPGNCWGDLWHNEQGAEGHNNDLQADGFARNGRTLAWWMVRLVTDPTFAEVQDIRLPVDVDPTQLYLFGLGEGGRGVVELMLRGDDMPPIQGALLDSTPDDLSAFTRDPETFEDEIEGLERIFTPDGLPNVDAYSLLVNADSAAWPNRLVYLWSDGDTRLPLDAVGPTASMLGNTDFVWTTNTHEMGHVLSNSDVKRAREVVDFLTTGAKPGSP